MNPLSRAWQPLTALWLGWKLVLLLCGLAAVLENLRQWQRHEFVVWLHFLSLFVLLLALLLTARLAQSTLLRRRLDGRAVRIWAAAAWSLLALLTTMLAWPVLNWLLGWRIPAWFALLCAALVEAAGLWIVTALPLEVLRAPRGMRAASLAVSALLAALTVLGIVFVLQRAQRVPLAVVRPPAPAGYWAAPLRCGSGLSAALSPDDYYYGRGYFDVYVFPVQPGRAYQISLDAHSPPHPRPPFFLRVEVSAPGLPEPDRSLPIIEPVDELTFTAPAAGTARLTVYGLMEGRNSEALGAYRLRLDCPP